MDQASLCRGCPPESRPYLARFASARMALQSVFSAFASPGRRTALAGTGHLATADVKDAVDTFPIPPRNARSLFYLQRTSNINTIICELNEKNGVAETRTNPCMCCGSGMRTGGNARSCPLSSVILPMDSKRRTWATMCMSCILFPTSKVLFYLMKSPLDNQHHVYASITGRQAILNRIYVKINPGGTFWSPNVEYLELKGVDTRNGKELIQRIKV
jgi:hypothetical protein